jgi:hypothetical protein
MGLLSHWCGFVFPCLCFALYLGIRHNLFALLLPLALSFPDDVYTCSLCVDRISLEL